MEGYPPPPPRPPRRGRPVPGWGKLLIVGAIGLVGLAFLGTVIFVAGIVWFFSRGSQADVRKLAGAGSEVVFYVDNSEGDPGINAAVDRFYVRLQRASEEMQSRQGDPFSQMNDAQLQQNMMAAKMIMPREAAFTRELPEGGADPVTVLALNPRSFGAFFKLVFRIMLGSNPETTSERHGGHVYQCFKEGSSIGFVGTTMVYSGSCELMPDIIDRLEGREATGRAADMLEEYISADPAYDLYGAIDNSGGALARWLAPEEEEAPSEETPAEEEPPGLADIVREMAEQGELTDLVQDVLMRVDLVTEDELEGQVVIGTRAGEAGAVGLIVEEIVKECGRVAAEEGMTLTFEMGASAGQVTVDFGLTGTGTLIDAFVEEMLEKE